MLGTGMARKNRPQNLECEVRAVSGLQVRPAAAGLVRFAWLRRRVTWCHTVSGVLELSFLRLNNCFNY